MNGIDARAWIVWAGAAMLPALVGRNPAMLLELLAIVTVVHIVCVDPGSIMGVRWFVRLAGILTIAGVVINVLTVHAGDLAFVALPDGWPIIGGPLTLNALVYGVVSAIALFTLVLAGTTAASLADWNDLFHAMPRRLAPIAVAGSVAWSFLPQTAIAFRQIRESQEMRGHRVRGVRDTLPLIVPLLAGSLERALETAEALEARGFGASPTSPGTPMSLVHRQGRPMARAEPFLIGGSLVLLISGAFGAMTGHPGFGMVAIAIGAIILLGVLRTVDDIGVRRTRYRSRRVNRTDGAIIGSAIVSITVTLIAILVRPEALAFEPYPSLTVPRFDPLVLGGVALLLAPAMIARSSIPSESR